MPSYATINDLKNVAGKVALVRVDLNVPVKDGKITDTTRIDRVKPTLDLLRAKNMKIVLMSYFGRPKGQIDPEYSLSFIPPVLKKRWGYDVQFVNDYAGTRAKNAVEALNNQDILLLENVRFAPREEKNDPNLAHSIASLGDIFVNDAFSVAHRSHASIIGLADHLPTFAGLLMDAELQALEQALETPKTPVTAIVGGAKISTKIDLLENLIEKVHFLVLGGGMANTFLAAQGHDLKNSLCEHDMLDTAKTIIMKAEEVGCRIILPSDVVCAKEFKAHAASDVYAISNVPDGMMALDIGPQSIQQIEAILNESKTVLWNGPVGAFEIPPFDQATNMLAGYVAQATRSKTLISIAGGGDTVAALKHANADQGFTYLSSAGGAFLEWLEGKELPGVAALSS
jgi:phosphoglycerate kinase